MNQETKWLADHLDSNEMLPEIEAAMAMCQRWSIIEHGYESKNQRIREWDPLYEDLYGVVVHIFVLLMLSPTGMTYQALVGATAGAVRCSDPLDRAKCVAELIALCFQADLIEIEKTSEQTMLVTTEFVAPDNMPTFGKHLPLFKTPEAVSYNPILGNRFKQHDADVCQQHINTMNAIPLVLEQRVIVSVEEYQKSEPETADQLTQWHDFKLKSSEAYIEVGKHAEFYLNHSYDTRGRVYCDGYYVTYQGSQYKKAIVQLANKEVICLS